MRGFELRYINKEKADSILHLCDSFIAGKLEVTEEELVNLIERLLPVDKLRSESVRQRVEGLYFASEVLWYRILSTHKLTREEVVVQAKLKPLSHYHYLLGSREPGASVMTRDDYYNDPATALAKLRDDIIGLASIAPSTLS